MTVNSVFSSSAAGRRPPRALQRRARRRRRGAHHHGRGGDAQALAQDLGHVVHFQEGEGADVVREANHAGGHVRELLAVEVDDAVVVGVLGGLGVCVRGESADGRADRADERPRPGRVRRSPASRRRRAPSRPGRADGGGVGPARRAELGAGEPRRRSPRGGRHLCGPRAPIGFSLQLRANARSKGEPPRDGRDETACVRRYARAWVDNAGVSARAIRGQRASRTAASRTFLSHPQSDCHAARTDARRISASLGLFRRGARGFPKILQYSKVENYLGDSVSLSRD